MSMARCAFLTLEEPLDFYIYDRLLVEPFAAAGWEVRELPWSEPAVDWSRFDAVIVRSTWDYQNHLEPFLQTLERIESQTRLFNSLAICQWNSNKRYLRDLEGRGSHRPIALARAAGFAADRGGLCRLPGSATGREAPRGSQLRQRLCIGGGQRRGLGGGHGGVPGPGPDHAAVSARHL